MMRIIDDYIECKNFAIKIMNNSICIYYYDSIDDFTSKKIVIFGNNKKYVITGNHLSIEKLDECEIIINGDFKQIEMGLINEI